MSEESKGGTCADCGADYYIVRHCRKCDRDFCNSCYEWFHEKHDKEAEAR